MLSHWEAVYRGFPEVFFAPREMTWQPAPLCGPSSSSREPGLLVGGRPLPRRALETWSSGFMPLAVRAYLRDEVKARGLRQSDVALSLGISRTQLVNILRGRFGAEPRGARPRMA